MILIKRAKYSDELIVMNNGSIIKQGKPKEVFSSELFRDIFKIKAKIFYDEDVPFYTPVTLLNKQFH